MQNNLSKKITDNEKVVVILSTFSCDIAYDIHDAINGKSYITVNGLSHAKGDDKGSLFITPENIATKVNLSTYELLKIDHVFSRHLKDGYLKVVIADKKEVQEDSDKDVSTVEKVEDNKKSKDFIPKDV